MALRLSCLKSPSEANHTQVFPLYWKPIVLLLGMCVLAVATLPNAAALPPCLLQNVNYAFPSSISLRQQVTVDTHLTMTCVEWAPYLTGYSIRVDLTNSATGYVLSTLTYQVGYAQTYVDQVFANTATAPNSPGYWPLRVDVYVWGGSAQLLIHLTDFAKLPVG